MKAALAGFIVGAFLRLAYELDSYTNCYYTLSTPVLQ
jgi:hypothetical protein